MFQKEKLITLRCYADPGHAWVAVKRRMLQDLGIADQITEYSFQKGHTVYLEEDQDLDTLLTALGARTIGVRLKETHTNRRSAIRGFERYRA